MDRQPTWLRSERSYRAYIRGFRYSLIGFLLAGAFGAWEAAGIIGRWVPIAGVLAAFVLAVGSVVACVVGWLLVPDKNRAAKHQFALLRMIAHDILRGLPSGSASGR